MSTIDNEGEDIVDYDEDGEMHESAIDHSDRFLSQSCPTFSNTDGYDPSVAQTGTITYVEEVLIVEEVLFPRRTSPDGYFPRVCTGKERNEMIEEMFRGNIQFDEIVNDNVFDYLVHSESKSQKSLWFL